MNRQAPSWKRWLLLYCAAMAVTSLSLNAYHVQTRSFAFDDAGMFFRYAMNMRMGYGAAWNPGGPHTFGITSLPWLWVTYAASFLPFHTPGEAFTFEKIKLFMIHLSWAFSVLPFIFFAFAYRAFSNDKRSFRAACLALTLYLGFVLNDNFQAIAANGMETMLAMGTLAVFGFVTERVTRTSTLSGMLGLAILGTFTTLVRPEAVIVAMLAPFSF